LALAPHAYDRLVLGIADPAALAGVRVLARSTPASPWREIAAVDRAAGLGETAAGVVVPIALAGPAVADQLEVALAFAPGTGAARLERIALVPSAQRKATGRRP
jgi:hypothetical protein